MLGGKQASGLPCTPDGPCLWGHMYSELCAMAPEGNLAAKPVCIRSMHCDHAYRLGSSLQGIMEACPKAQARASRGEPAASPTGAACIAGQHQQLAGNSRVWCMLTGRARHAAPAEPATSRQDGGDEFQSVQRPLGGGRPCQPTGLLPSCTSERRAPRVGGGGKLSESGRCAPSVQPNHATLNS